MNPERRLRDRFRAAFAAFLLCAGAAGMLGAVEDTKAPEPAKPAGPRLIVRSFGLNRHNEYLDGQWQGITVASDGKCYFGSSSHAHARAGSFFCYDPAAGEVKVLSNDMSALCGEDASKQVPQGKTHSPIVEFEGWIYFATHLATYWPEAKDGYPGSHIIGYELATGKFRDLGITRPNYTCYSAVAVDPNRKVLYAISVPFAEAEIKNGGTHLYQVDIKTAEKKDLGAFKTGQGACFWILVDKRGNCWFSSAWDNGGMYCYRPETGKIERTDDALPKTRSVANPQEEAKPIEEKKATQAGRYIGWMHLLPDGNSCLFSMNSSRHLPDIHAWRFDSTKALAEAFQPVRCLGVNGAKAVAGDRLYYLQRECREPRDAPKDRQDIHLMSVPLDGASDAAPADHGLIEDQDGRRPNRICSMVADGKGRVFMTGDWWVLPGEKGSLSIEYLQKKPEDGNFVYKQRETGQFFAVADVTKSPKKD